MWKTPSVKEVAVGLEINCYACAEIQYMFSFVSALANLITKILPFILMRKAGADAAVKKGLLKIEKLKKKKNKIKQDVARTSISDVTHKLLDRWKRSD